MSEFLTPAAQALNAPEAIVLRSAGAKAKATGATVDAVLAAWAGGAAVVGSAPPPDPAPSPPTAVEAAPAPVVAETTQVSQPEAVTTVAVLDHPGLPAIPAGALSDRVRLGAKVGWWTGAVSSLVVMVFSTQWLLPRAILGQSDGESFAAANVVPGWVVVGTGLLGVASGLAFAAFTRGVVGWKSAGHALVTTQTATAAIGAGVGLVIGLLTGAIITGSGQVLEGQEGIVQIPILGGLVWMGIGWALMGGLVGTLVQFFGTPVGVTADELHETHQVRRRLGAAFGFPVRVALTIIMVVLPLAYAFLSFPKFAPLVAGFVAASVLALAGLSTSRPNLKISRGEFLVAAGGVITVVVIVVSVLAAQGSGGHEVEGGGSQTASHEG